MSVTLAPREDGVLVGTKGGWVLGGTDGRMSV